MHVSLTIGLPLISGHEKAQGVKTRNFMAVKNGDAVNPIMFLTGQDPASFTSVTLDPADNPLHYGDKIELELRDVDQAGNVSDPLNGSIVLVDTTAPDSPVGSFTMTINEIADPGDDGSITPPADTTTPPASPPADSTGDTSSPPGGQG